MKLPSKNKWLYDNGIFIAYKENWYEAIAVRCPYCSKVINTLKADNDHYHIGRSVFIFGNSCMGIECKYCNGKLGLIKRC